MPDSREQGDIPDPDAPEVPLAAGESGQQPEQPRSEQPRSEQPRSEQPPSEQTQPEQPLSSTGQGSLGYDEAGQEVGRQEGTGQEPGEQEGEFAWPTEDPEASEAPVWPTEDPVDAQPAPATPAVERTQRFGPLGAGWEGSLESRVADGKVVEDTERISWPEADEPLASTAEHTAVGQGDVAAERPAGTGQAPASAPADAEPKPPMWGSPSVRSAPPPTPVDQPTQRLPRVPPHPQQGPAAATQQPGAAAFRPPPQPSPRYAVAPSPGPPTVARTDYREAHADEAVAEYAGARDHDHFDSPEVDAAYLDEDFDGADFDDPGFDDLDSAEFDAEYEAADSGALPASRTAEDAPRRRKRGVLITVAVVVVVVLGAGLALTGSGWFGNVAHQVPPPPERVRLEPAIKPVGGNAPIPTNDGLAAALEPVVSNPALGTFGGIVIDAVTGRALWKQEAQRALVPASTMKLLSTGAALLALGPDFQFTTRVVRGREPGSIVLVGGGDPTLSSLPADQNSVYPAAASLGKLVAEVKKATTRPVTSIVVDTSRYTGPGLAPGWLEADVANGYVAPIQPVMLDGGRADPTELVSPRSSEPALDAARELARRLGVDPSTVRTGTAPRGAAVLGAVQSAPLHRMVRTVLMHSDNVLAEALARQVAIATGHEASFKGATAAVGEVLTKNGVDLSGTRLVDASGLSVDNRVTPKALGSLLLAASADKGPDGKLTRKTIELRPLLAAIPVAGGSGSLAQRYQGEAASGQGWVRAKTGTLTDVNALAGTVVTSDGRLLVFAFLSNGTSSTVARPALDQVAATLRECGCR